MVTTRPQPHLTLEVAPDVRELAGVRAAVRQWLGDHHVAVSTTEDMALAVTELCTNAIEAAPATPVGVAATIDDDAVCLEVSNQVAVDGRPSRGSFTPGSLQSRGRGLAIVEALCEDVSMRTARGRTTVRARHRR